MQYFTEEFFHFMKELDQNNYKEWFHENKKRYETNVKNPLYGVTQDVIHKIQEKFDSELELEVKNAVFRINRDIRFAKDKTPYKTHVAAVVSRGGRKNLSYPGIYFHVGLDGTFIGGGCHQPSKDQLHAIRSKIVKEKDRLNELLKDKEFVKVFGGITGDKNKIIPKDFKPHIEEIPVLANKQFYFMANYELSDVLNKEDIADFIVDHYRIAEPWNLFLTEAMNE